MIFRIVVDIDSDRPEVDVKRIVDDPTTWIPIARLWMAKGIEVDRIALIGKVEADQSRSARRRMIRLLRT